MSHVPSHTKADLIMGSLKEIYLSIFVLFFRLTRWDGRMKADAASLFVSGVTFALILVLWAALQTMSGQYIALSRWIVGGGGAVIAILNGYFLVNRGYGVAFEKKFRHFDRGKQIALYVAAVSSIAAVGIAFYFVVSNYHQVFNLPRK